METGKGDRANGCGHLPKTVLFVIKSDGACKKVLGGGFPGKNVCCPRARHQAKSVSSKGGAWQQRWPRTRDG